MTTSLRALRCGFFALAILAAQPALAQIELAETPWDGAVVRFREPPPDQGLAATADFADYYDHGPVAGAEHPRMLPPTSKSIDELSRRLQQTENELEKLRFAQAPRMGDPAVETVDEQTRGGSSAGSLGDAVRNRWNQIQDPAITTVDQQTRDKPGEKKNWFDRLSIRGYSQFRINEVMSEDGAPAHHVGDRSVGENQSFLIRRARIILSGDVSDRMYVYIQPDFAASVPGSPDANQFTQLRDCYCDLYFDDEKIHRLRVGQSKIPYGWENLQSSSNRIPLDRNDGINSAARNERDLGVFYYYTPDFAQDLFKYVLDEGLKGSGNYGLFGFGVYNGQGGSFNEQNDNLHIVARLAVPYQFDCGQVMELGIQGYTGKYVVLTSPIAPLGVPPARSPTVQEGGYLDERVAGTFVWYPQPWGFQTEWNVGRGPALNEAQTAVVEKSLYGGYAMAMYRFKSDDCGTLFPFVRWHYYKGGYKAERNAPDSLIDEFEFGLEWQFNPQMELTTQFAFTDRTNTVARTTGDSYGQFDGSLARIQFQMNY